LETALLKLRNLEAEDARRKEEDMKKSKPEQDNTSKVEQLLLDAVPCGSIAILKAAIVEAESAHVESETLNTARQKLSILEDAEQQRRSQDADEKRKTDRRHEQQLLARKRAAEKKAAQNKASDEEAGGQDPIPKASAHTVSEEEVVGQDPIPKASGEEAAKTRKKRSAFSAKAAELENKDTAEGGTSKTRRSAFSEAFRSSVSPPSSAPELPVWKVIGGVGLGGIKVRMARELDSEFFDDRLTTGALVEQLELYAERLHYRLCKGYGPVEGWVSTQIGEKTLLIPQAEALGGSSQ